MSVDSGARLAEVIEQARARVVAWDDDPIVLAFYDLHLEWAESCTSPIEELLYMALASNPCVLLQRWDIAPNERFGPFTIDIFVESDRHDARFAVECDGRDFHDVTHEQRQRDRERDRQLMRQEGIVTLRYSGSEIYRDPFACATDVFQTIGGVVSRLKPAPLGQDVPA